MSKEIEQKILSRIGSPVDYAYPEGPKHGILDDRSVIESNPLGGVPYWDVVDLIRFDDEDEPWIRIGYYRMPPRTMRLNFAGQTTISEPVSVWKTLLVKAAREKTWFRDLLDDVMDDLERPAAQEQEH